METIARHYTSPTTPPKLVVHTTGVATSAPKGIVCLRCGSSTGHAPHRLVSFEWGRVAPSNLRR